MTIEVIYYPVQTRDRSMSVPSTDSLLNGRYQLLELIGRGAMGRVYKAKDTRLGGAIVAVKFLAQTLLNERMRKRFWSEASMCAQLGQKSIHIIRVSDYDLDPEDVPFYVMEYLEGDGLNDIIRERPLPLPRFLSLTRQMCLGLHAAHQGIDVDGTICPIIHRDIKPSNMMVMQDPSLGEFVKVLDFGISKLLQEDSGQTSTYMGTMVYSSPEQMEGRELTPCADIYSMGVMMYEMLTGELPVMAETHSFGGWLKAHMTQKPRMLTQHKSCTNLPKPLERLIMACLAKEPDGRPSDVNQILQELAPIEERFSANQRLSNRIGQVLNRQANDAAQSLDIDSIEPPSAPITPFSSEPKRAKALVPVSPPTVVPPTVVPPTVVPPTVVPPAKPQAHPAAPALPINLFQATVSGDIETELLRSAVWPQKEVPPAQVAFPKLMEVAGQPVVTLWVMLDSYEEVKKIKLSKLYNQVYKTFLCTPTPYPLALWITAFYNHLYHQENGPRWMPCYLDLKTKQGIDMVRLLGLKGQYQLLLFAKELPQKCAYVTTIKINEALQSNLQEWVINTPNWQVVGNPLESKKISRQLLKDELTKLKPRIGNELGQQASRKFGSFN
jgi:eukaryotic-like serine/threonine-protein kinase